jgi:hypothetical protein
MVHLNNGCINIYDNDVKGNEGKEDAEITPVIPKCDTQRSVELFSSNKHSIGIQMWHSGC